MTNERNAVLADELAALVHEVGNADRKHGKFDPGDTLSFVTWCREMDKAKVALANHVLDQWALILDALRAKALSPIVSDRIDPSLSDVRASERDDLD